MSLRSVVPALRCPCAPLSLRSVVPALLLVCLMLTASHVHAGTYVGIYTDPGTLAVSPYTGGTYIVPGQNGTPQSFPDKIGTTQNLAAGYGGDSGGVTASCTGAITVAWKWTHGQNQNDANDPPPAQVIISESCSVQVTVVSPMATGSYDTGMGETGTVSWSPGGSNTKTATHVRYSVLAGGASVTLPAVNASAVAASPGDTASVRYTAAVYFPKIILLGENPNINQALSGQQIQANLIWTNSLPSGTKITIYTWSFTGATAPNPIKDWVGTNIPGQLIPLTAADLTGTDTTGNGISVSPVNFYDQIADKKVIVNCAINLTFPNGTTGSVNAQSIPVSFVVPTASWIVGQPVDNANPGFVFDNVQHNDFYVNETWGPITITEPPALVPDGPGTGCIVQIANLSRSFTRTPQNGQPANYSKMLVSFGSNITRMVANPTGLDSNFPYSSGYILSGNGSWTVVKSNYTWAANTAGYSGDAPTQPFTTSDQDGGGTQWYSSTADDAFITWVMYRPPPYFTGQGTTYVPLQVLNWSWGGSASLNATTHVWSGRPGPPLTPGSASNWSTPPAWSLLVPSPLTFGP